MIEAHLISAAIRSRDAAMTIQDHLDHDDLSPLSRHILNAIGEYYSRDSECEKVNVDILIEKLGNQFAGNKKHIEQMTDAIQDAMGQDVSARNVADLVLEQKRRTIGMKLAESLLNGDDSSEFIEQYLAITEASSIDEALGNEVNDADIGDLLNVLDNEQKIRVYPRSLNDRIDGGLVRGDFMILAARPECGKSAFVVTNMAGMAYRGQKVLFLGNEDALNRIIVRTISCLTGRDKSAIIRDPEGTMEIARQRGYQNIIFGYPVRTIPHIKALIKKHRPDVVILDQLRNVAIKADNRTGQLEQSAIAVRSMMGEFNCAGIAVTQAGESAEGKLRLTMSDLDNSKTGIPGACDIMCLIGMDQNFDAANSRMLSLGKNKATGQHDSWAVKIDKALSRYYDEN